MKQLILLLKKWKAALKAETPNFWKWIAGVCGYVPIAVSAINIATSGTIAPEWYTNNQFYLTAIPAVILLFAKSQTKKEKK